MTTTNNNNKKTGRALLCLNANITDADYREHIMKVVYVRASLQESKSIRSRAMKAVGFICFRCCQFWTNEDVDNKIMEKLQRLREKQVEKEYAGRHNNSDSN